MVVPSGAHLRETYSLMKNTISNNTATSSPQYQILLYSEG